MASNPPISYLTTAEGRALDLHNYQVFDMVASSGQHTVSTPQALVISNVTGSGPIYNISFDTAVAADISVGDMYISADNDGGTISWYRYDITTISSASSSTVNAQIKYIKDSEDFGSASPSDVKLSSQVSYDLVLTTRAHLLCRKVSVDTLLIF